MHFFNALNWAGSFLILTGLYFIGEKKRFAFIFTFFGELCILSWALSTRAWPIVFVGVTFAFMAARNWVRWGQK